MVDFARSSIIPIRAFQDNYIWLWQDAQGNACVVDPGDAQPVISYLRNHQLNLTDILITHHHHDHCGGLPELIRAAPSVRIYGAHNSPNQYITQRVQAGDSTDVVGLPLKVLAIPGHTLDHLAFYSDGLVFCGDTLFSAGCGRIFEGTVPQMYASLQLLSTLPEMTRIYCGHEYTLANLNFAQHVEPLNHFIQDKMAAAKTMSCTLPSLMIDEHKMNPFLRCSLPKVTASVEEYAQQSLSSPVDVFKYLREWKNNFRSL